MLLTMRNLIFFFEFAVILIISTSCNNDNCQKCSHRQGGVAGSSITEERVVCDEKEAADLEASSRANDTWRCE